MTGACKKNDAMAEQIFCPCCERPMDGGTVPVEALLDAPLTPMESDIVDKLASSYPRSVGKLALYEYAYAFRDEPGSDRIIDVYLHRLRRKLPRWGWTIANAGHVGGPGCRGLYRLVPVPCAAGAASPSKAAGRHKGAVSHTRISGWPSRRSHGGGAVCVVTDNHMSTAERFPGHPIISTVNSVLGLGNGTRVILDSVRIGKAVGCPIAVARALIERNVLMEVV